ncbi:serine/threonine protein phosphatase [Dulcicalothrix desertica PCC 7102]|uniref:Serine/threonine protein phosphatase n=1 Tax=Dulcicalothrix desertica PCC 7102 TaxID=232991 RepID=A0A433VQ61_9CYAN|nr:serine/threonine phosphatase [Dulcicalothrix desertica]RUT08227.1 serine/threonine protein phosphatase [Dulcicalothrix desertica PCC 7102]TWH40098.1 protein phosphatase [Dulcicalothrix desertica PCC 7102]
MLICPECKFENPDKNKFCQNCGTSLTERACPACGADVPNNVEQCQHCGKDSGTIWWGIIKFNEDIVTNDSNSNVEAPPVEVSTFIQIDVPTPVLELEQKKVISKFEVGSYLDKQERYKVLECSETQAGQQELLVRVLDCKPYQITPITAQLEQGLSSVIEAPGIPNVAKPYLALHKLCNYGIPPIHDAWVLENMSVVLLVDRSNYSYLLELWLEDEMSSLQVVHYFHRMTQLWQMLEPFNCRQSLLELTNLRLDEDQELVLQRLYTESSPGANVDFEAFEPSETLSIKALANIWHTLFKQSQRTQFGPLMQLLGDLDVGTVETLEQLQARLRKIASELEPTPTIEENNHDTKDIHDNYESEDVTVTMAAAPNTAVPTVLQLVEAGENEIKSDDMPTVVLPMQLNSLDNAGLTDVGRQRDHNEDYFGIETRINRVEFPKAQAIAARGLYILCDGMGGHASGEVASELAVTTLQKYFNSYWNFNHLPSLDIIKEGVRQANKAIYDLNQKDARSGVGRMGTTLVMLLIQDTHVAVAHVGDSRMYCLTRRGLEQVTIDHEVGQREIMRGVEPSIAYGRPDAYQLTQALGPRDENLIDPDVHFFQINEDSLFILASDGLTDNNLLETNWQTHLKPLLSSNANLDKGTRELIDLANKCNGHDNITAVLVRAKVRPNPGAG